MSIKTRDLTNQRFGRWVAVKKISNTNPTKWLCQCDCGSIKEIDVYNLVSGKTKSCGCITKERIKDLTNQRFGKLVAIKRLPITGPSKWLCQCDCGNTTEVLATNLLKNTTKSCGCLMTKDLTNQRFGKLVALKKVNTIGETKWLCQCDCGNTKEIFASRLLIGKTKSCGCLREPQDLANQRFGRLVALKKVNTTGKAKWLCQCDCGNTTKVLATNLLRNTTKSCGCLKKSKTKDLTNQRFGKLVAIRRINTKGKAKWLCQCDCGNTTEVLATNLLKRTTKGCEECYRNIPIGTRFGRLVVLKKTTKKDKNSEYLYECQCDCGNIAYVPSSRLKRGKTKSCGCYYKDMRSVMAKEVVKKYKMDGTYIPTLTAKIAKNNTSGYTGVSYSKKRNRWIAQIMLKRKIYCLGSFEKKEDAIKARRRAEEELFEPILEKFAELQKK